MYIYRAWNIDNICKVKEERSVVNTASSTSLKAEDFAPTGATEKMFAKSDASKSASSSSASASTATSTASATTASTAPKTKTEAKNTASPSAFTVATVGPTTENVKLSSLSYNDYVLEHADLMEQFSEIHSLEKTQEFLVKHAHVLLHDHAQSYMLLSCLEDEMNGKHKRMKQVCRQSQLLSHISELAASMRRDPRDMIIPLFMRLQEASHLTAFNSAVNDFIKRIQERAVAKRAEMDEENRAERLRKIANGETADLDPNDVLMMLPECMQLAFEHQVS